LHIHAQFIILRQLLHTDNLFQKTEPSTVSDANQEKPVYLRELVQQTCEMASISNLHSSANHTYVKFRTKTKFGECTFSIAGPLT